MEAEPAPAHTLSSPCLLHFLCCFQICFCSGFLDDYFKSVTYSSTVFENWGCLTQQHMERTKAGDVGPTTFLTCHTTTQNISAFTFLIPPLTRWTCWKQRFVGQSLSSRNYKTFLRLKDNTSDKSVRPTRKHSSTPSTAGMQLSSCRGPPEEQLHTRAPGSRPEVRQEDRSRRPICLHAETLH